MLHSINATAMKLGMLLYFGFEIWILDFLGRVLTFTIGNNNWNISHFSRNFLLHHPSIARTQITFGFWRKWIKFFLEVWFLFLMEWKLNLHNFKRGRQEDKPNRTKEDTEWTEEYNYCKELRRKAWQRIHNLSSISYQQNHTSMRRCQYMVVNLKLERKQRTANKEYL